MLCLCIVGGEVQKSIRTFLRLIGPACAHSLHQLEARNELTALDFTRSTHLVHSMSDTQPWERTRLQSSRGMAFKLFNASRFRMRTDVPDCSPELKNRRPCKGERDALWVDKHRVGTDRYKGELADLPKRR